MSQKIVISKAGYNYDDTDPTHLIFSSDYNSLKTAYSGSFTAVVAGNSSTQISLSDELGIPSPLTWIPLCLTYFTEEQLDPADNQYYIAMSNPLPAVGDRGTGNFNVQLSVSSTDVFWDIINFDASERECTVYYEVFYEGI